MGVPITIKNATSQLFENAQPAKDEIAVPKISVLGTFVKAAKDQDWSNLATAPKLAMCKPQNEARGPSTVSRLLTPENLAEITGLSTETLAQWRSQRRGIPFVKISRNCVRYRQADLDRWLEERIVRVENDPSNARRNN